MKPLQFVLMVTVSICVVCTGCKSLNKTQKGAAIGTAGGGALGAIIGKATGNTGLGAIIGATVGGVSGAVIGHKMDKQAEEIKKQVPGVKVDRVGEGIVVEFNSAILFGFDRADLSATAQKKLDDLAVVLNKYPDTDIEIQGHTDSTGKESYNQTLSEKRAASVASYLLNKSIVSSRITTKGFGETVPKYSNLTESGRAENRRVEFLITANDKMKADANKEADKSTNQ